MQEQSVTGKGQAAAEEECAALWALISPAYCCDETALLEAMNVQASPSELELRQIRELCERLIREVRADSRAQTPLDALLLEYSLNSQEGMLLMCLAEALLRIPDAATQDALIRDKFRLADWSRHLGHSDSWLVNASSWGLLLTGKLVAVDASVNWAGQTQQLIGRLSEPVIRQCLLQAMALMGEHFVLGRTIGEARGRSSRHGLSGQCYSFDMLGEAALTMEQADAFFAAYRAAIAELGGEPAQPGVPRSSISIKLSALHPRYQPQQWERLEQELLPRLLELVRQARRCDVPITIDAEEADRLELSLRLFEQLYRHADNRGWGGLGLVVQAYSKRALPVLQWLRALALAEGDPIPVRLVKGAYWDQEIKYAQQKGLDGFPVYTRKAATDLAYLACARFLLQQESSEAFYPQFATHNAHTLAAVLGHAHSCSWLTDASFEFQRLHGMGDALYRAMRRHCKVPIRVYAPVGAHQELLPYLVRRLLENGSNSSFVHQIHDPGIDASELSEHPTVRLERYDPLLEPVIRAPAALFAERKNSRGLNLAIDAQWQRYRSLISPFLTSSWPAGPMIGGHLLTVGAAQPVCSPFDPERQVGICYPCSPAQIGEALDRAERAFAIWRDTPVRLRAACLERWADLLETQRGELYLLCQREAGKTLNDAIDEVREAVDFCRYYAAQAKAKLEEPISLCGPDGRTQSCRSAGLGPVVCISPWNFPLAIFVGQVAAALVAGNTVLAKPAAATPLIAARAIGLLLETGLPVDAVALLPASGAILGETLLSDTRVAAVAFTGSTETARSIHQRLAARDAPPPVLIAETGGQNVMLVDSTALPEQVVRDAIDSAFTSAGQRCSALRVLLVQEECADTIEPLLAGALAQLQLGDPELRSTDIGPVISREARESLMSYAAELDREGRLLARGAVPESARGYFVPPSIYRLAHLTELDEEHFGPILHVVRFARGELDSLLDEINGSGFGLTMGIHSRNENLVQWLADRVQVGNLYINRNQIGAVVGVQPFGGRGLSGTGPKAGGPHYLLRFTQEVAL